jgi:hypothetical protein
MAELILSDEDKAAARWLQMDDVSVGRLVKYTQLAILRDADEQQRVWWWSAALLLCSMADEAGSDNTKFKIEGVTLENGAVPIGDWEVVVRRRIPETKGGVA